MTFPIKNKAILVAIAVCIIIFESCFAENFPKVSIIVPVYKVEKYLRQCLDSLVNQTLRDIEIICVNDGSPDHCEEILEEYAEKDSRVIVIAQENQGLSAARNAGMKIARGEYIGFVDGDDWVDLNYFEKLYHVAKKYDADAAGASVCSVSESAQFLRWEMLFRDEEVAKSPAEKYELYNIPEYCHVWNKIYRKTELGRQKLTFRVGEKYEDIEFSTKFLYYCGKMVTIPNIYYYYRQRGNSIIHTHENNADQEIAMERARAFMRERNMPIPAESYEDYEIFGINVLTIQKCGRLKMYYLFGKFLFNF